VYLCDEELSAGPTREIQRACGATLPVESITLGELQYGAEKSARRAENLTADHFVARPSETRRLRIMDKRVRNWSERERPVVRTTCRSAVMRAAKD
jgi:hypothetical protein